MAKLITIKLRPTFKQHLAYQLLFDVLTTFILFGGGAGGGKSWLGCEWLLAMCYNYPGTRWFIGRKQLKRLMTTTFLTFQKVCAYHQVPRGDWKLNGEYNYIQFKNGSRIYLLDLNEIPSDPLFERLGSTEYTGGWIEEAGEIVFQCFDVLKSRIGRHLNDEYGLIPKLLLTCNPTQNWLYRVFYKPWREGLLEAGYAFIQALADENRYLAKSYINSLEGIKDPVLKARLKGGMWEYTSDDLVLMGLDNIIKIYEQREYVSEARYLIADIARFGSDKIVIGIWHGLKCIKIIEKEKQGIDQTIKDIEKLAVDYGILPDHILIDEDGVGGGVVDFLKKAIGFMGGSKALPNIHDDRKENYKNLRAQCYFTLAEKVNENQIYISAELAEDLRERITEELQQIKRVDNAVDAPLQIVSKDEIKQNIGRSPDRADMLMMRMYFEIQKPPKKYYPPDPEKLRKLGVQSNFGGVQLYPGMPG